MSFLDIHDDDDDDENEVVLVDISLYTPSEYCDQDDQKVDPQESN